MSYDDLAPQSPPPQSPEAGPSSLPYGHRHVTESSSDDDAVPHTSRPLGHQDRMSSETLTPHTPQPPQSPEAGPSSSPDGSQHTADSSSIRVEHRRRTKKKSGIVIIFRASPKIREMRENDEKADDELSALMKGTSIGSRKSVKFAPEPKPQPEGPGNGGKKTSRLSHRYNPMGRSSFKSRTPKYSPDDIDEPSAKVPSWLASVDPGRAPPRGTLHPSVDPDYFKPMHLTPVQQLYGHDGGNVAHDADGDRMVPDDGGDTDREEPIDEDEAHDEGDDDGMQGDASGEDEPSDDDGMRDDNSGDETDGDDEEDKESTKAVADDDEEDKESTKAVADDEEIDRADDGDATPQPAPLVPTEPSTPTDVHVSLESSDHWQPPRPPTPGPVRESVQEPLVDFEDIDEPSSHQEPATEYTETDVAQAVKLLEEIKISYEREQAARAQADADAKEIFGGSDDSDSDSDGALGLKTGAISAGNDEPSASSSSRRSPNPPLQAPEERNEPEEEVAELPPLSISVVGDAMSPSRDTTSGSVTPATPASVFTAGSSTVALPLLSPTPTESLPPSRTRSLLRSLDGLSLSPKPHRMSMQERSRHNMYAGTSSPRGRVGASRGTRRVPSCLRCKELESSPDHAAVRRHRFEHENEKIRKASREQKINERRGLSSGVDDMDDEDEEDDEGDGMDVENEGYSPLSAPPPQPCSDLLVDADCPMGDEISGRVVGAPQRAQQQQQPQPQPESVDIDIDVDVDVADTHHGPAFASVQPATPFATSWAPPQQSAVASSAYQPPEVFDVSRAEPMAMPSTTQPQVPEQMAVEASGPAVVAPSEDQQQHAEMQCLDVASDGAQPETAIVVTNADDNVPAPESTEPLPMVASAGPSIVIQAPDDDEDKEDDETDSDEEDEDDELEPVPIPVYEAPKDTAKQDEDDDESDEDEDTDDEDETDVDDDEEDELELVPIPVYEASPATAEKDESAPAAPRGTATASSEVVAETSSSDERPALVSQAVGSSSSPTSASSATAAHQPSPVARTPARPSPAPSPRETSYSITSSSTTHPPAPATSTSTPSSVPPSATVPSGSSSPSIVPPTASLPSGFSSAIAVPLMGYYPSYNPLLGNEWLSQLTPVLPAPVPTGTNQSDREKRLANAAKARTKAQMAKAVIAQALANANLPCGDDDNNSGFRMDVSPSRPNQPQRVAPADNAMLEDRLADEVVPLSNSARPSSSGAAGPSRAQDVTPGQLDSPHDDCAETHMRVDKGKGKMSEEEYSVEYPENMGEEEKSEPLQDDDEKQPEWLARLDISPEEIEYNHAVFRRQQCVSPPKSPQDEGYVTASPGLSPELIRRRPLPTSPRVPDEGTTVSPAEKSSTPPPSPLLAVPEVSPIPTISVIPPSPEVRATTPDNQRDVLPMVPTVGATLSPVPSQTRHGAQVRPTTSRKISSSYSARKGKKSGYTKPSSASARSSSALGNGPSPPSDCDSFSFSALDYSSEALASHSPSDAFAGTEFSMDTSSMDALPLQESPGRQADVTTLHDYQSQRGTDFPDLDELLQDFASLVGPSYAPVEESSWISAATSFESSTSLGDWSGTDDLSGPPDVELPDSWDGTGDWVAGGEQLQLWSREELEALLTYETVDENTRSDLQARGSVVSDTEAVPDIPQGFHESPVIGGDAPQDRRSYDSQTPDAAHLLVDWSKSSHPVSEAPTYDRPTLEDAAMLMGFVDLSRPVVSTWNAASSTFADSAGLQVGEDLGIPTFPVREGAVEDPEPVAASASDPLNLGFPVSSAMFADVAGLQARGDFDVPTSSVNEGALEDPKPVTASASETSSLGFPRSVQVADEPVEEVRFQTPPCVVDMPETAVIVEAGVQDDHRVVQEDAPIQAVPAKIIADASVQTEGLEVAVETAVADAIVQTEASACAASEPPTKSDASVSTEDLPSHQPLLPTLGDPTPAVDSSRPLVRIRRERGVLHVPQSFLSAGGPLALRRPRSVPPSRRARRLSTRPSGPPLSVPVATPPPQSETSPVEEEERSEVPPPPPRSPSPPPPPHRATRGLLFAGIPGMESRPLAAASRTEPSSENWTPSEPSGSQSRGRVSGLSGVQVHQSRQAPREGRSAPSSSSRPPRQSHGRVPKKRRRTRGRRTDPSPPPPPPSDHSSSDSESTLSDDPSPVYIPGWAKPRGWNGVPLEPEKKQEEEEEEPSEPPFDLSLKCTLALVAALAIRSVVRVL
ncbi:hypothetical protein K466DRAFT_656610 [Polyporus arcularius HHB13444]|uniref:Uncharacterized protein n=1 Tax=Polyporus arcularius HHB13444 TaxID=1314778 RepID=A0A5C3NSX9_9APHY|nr:hypothetical protein K466DRAFT_656610 [Polyporus arcularius HHB13444]